MIQALQPARRARIQAIADAAAVREALGQGAHHRRLPDGRHEIHVFDRRAGELRTWTADALAAAIAAAQQEQGR
jgi:hypothetical protein